MMECQYCAGPCKKEGKQAGGEQKYRCKTCGKYQQKHYTYQACRTEIKQLVPRLMTEGNSYRGLARGLGISRKTITKIIYTESGKIQRPQTDEERQSYEMDETQTYINKNEPSHYVYVAYAINRETKQPVDFIIGKRSLENLKKVTKTVLSLNPKRIYTDGLNLYPSLIKKDVHRASRFMTVNIERAHLTLRTRIRALQRKTICYAKSLSSLNALITLLFWG